MEVLIWGHSFGTKEREREREREMEGFKIVNVI
jgi:hypothetical protein